MATRTYIGGAVATKDKYTVTVALTWAQNDTITVTINGHDLVVTIGTLTTTAQVATTLKQAWEGESLTDTSASVSPSGGGAAIGEHSQFTATVSSSVVTLTADVAGVAFPTISVTEATAGDGTATESHTVTATGPNHFNNVDNWLEGAAATTGDDMIWDRPVSILYDLDQSAVTLTSLTIGPRVTSAYSAGLLEQNTAGAAPYEEGNETFLTISATTVTCYGTSGRIKWNGGSAVTTLTVHSTGTATETGRAAFQFVGTHASNVVNVFGGDIGIAANNGEAATVLTLRQTAGTLVCGSSATLTTVNKTGGTITVESNTTTFTNDGTLTIRGGTHTLLTTNSGTGSITGSTTLTAFRMNGGTVTCGPNCTHNSITKTAGTLVLNAGCTTITNDGGALTIHAGNFTTATINEGTFTYNGTGTGTNLYIGDATVTTGPNVVLVTVHKQAGTATFWAGMTTLITYSDETSVESGNITNLSVLGGTFNYKGVGTITALNADNCVLDFSGNTQACTVTTINDVGRPIDIRDPAERVTWTNGLPTGRRIKLMAV